ncbi:MAG TPA: GxxExxY protein [Tepidisphaeraceae bacterium]|nr:GxxExxY protein [Tepidisphaeraceae bacterium]
MGESNVARFEPDEELNRIAGLVIGSAIEVHRVLGPGFLESHYELALAAEMTRRGLRFVRQPIVSLEYKGELIGDVRLDLLVEGRLVVELKAVDQLTGMNTAQLVSYLKATRNHLGLLINFNVVALKDGIKRVIAS